MYTVRVEENGVLAHEYITITMISFLIVVSFVLWFNREKLIWLETVTVIKQACSVDLENLEVEYEYENTLRRFYETEPRHGSILVSFTCSPEYAEEVLFKYKDRLCEHLECDEGEELTKELEVMESSVVLRGKIIFAPYHYSTILNKISLSSFQNVISTLYFKYTVSSYTNIENVV